MSEVKVNKISPRTNCGTTQLGDAGDTITVTGDLKSNSLKSASGSTITLGQSGDTIQLGCGASQTGFGRTGTVDWDTTAKTSAFTAVSGNGYFVNTTSGAITVTLPASPSAGDIVSLADYTNTWGTNSVTVGRNSQPIGGIAADAVLSTKGQSVTFIYVDGTEGWKNVQDSTSNVTGNPNLIATGGTETTCGDFKIHTFTGPGTFTVSQISSTPANNTVGYLVIAGGGSGGSNFGDGSGGGGAGGFREGRNVPVDNFTASPLVANAPTNAVTVTATSYPITVGGGATGGPGAGSQGSSSIFSTITSAGGGLGANSSPPGVNPSTYNGGSGGGAGGGANPGRPGGAGNTPPVSPPQGNPGGIGGNTTPDRGAGGGGGAGSSGSGSPGPTAGGGGGNGVATSITGSSVTRAGGGGGNVYACGATGPGPAGSGGASAGGGSGASSNATANTGSGSGGAGPAGSGNGGSGIVVIRYKYQ